METTFKPGHKRSGSDVIDSLGEQPPSQDARNDKLQNRSRNLSASFQSTSRSMENINTDTSGNVPSKTELDGGNVRSMTLDINSDQKQKSEDWKKSKTPSRDLLDATPLSPPPGDPDVEMYSIG